MIVKLFNSSKKLKNSILKDIKNLNKKYVDDVSHIFYDHECYKYVIVYKNEFYICQILNMGGFSPCLTCSYASALVVIHSRYIHRELTTIYYGLM